jgi:hypothetical protein
VDALVNDYADAALAMHGFAPAGRKPSLAELKAFRRWSDAEHDIWYEMTPDERQTAAELVHALISPSTF